MNGALCESLHDMVERDSGYLGLVCLDPRLCGLFAPCFLFIV